MTIQISPMRGPDAQFATAINRTITVAGTPIAYRTIGEENAIPLLMLNHWGAVLDNFDPRIVDGLAQTRRVFATDYPGIGGSGGTARLTVEEMADDAIALIRALGFSQVDLLGFSLGGFVAQAVVLKAPELVRKLILTGTGPAGGAGIDRVWSMSWPLMIKGLLTLRDPKFYLFFTSSTQGKQAAKAFLKRLKERKHQRDKAPSPAAFMRQLKAIQAWGKQPPHDLRTIKSPTLIANGDNDIMVPSLNSADLARRIPNAQLVIYDDAGHGGMFQNYEDFVERAAMFLED